MHVAKSETVFIVRLDLRSGVWRGCVLLNDRLRDFASIAVRHQLTHAVRPRQTAESADSPINANADTPPSSESPACL